MGAEGNASPAPPIVLDFPTRAEESKTKRALTVHLVPAALLVLEVAPLGGHLARDLPLLLQLLCQTPEIQGPCKGGELRQRTQTSEDTRSPSQLTPRYILSTCWGVSEPDAGACVRVEGPGHRDESQD